MIQVYVGIPSRTKGYWSMYKGLLNNLITCARAGVNLIIDPLVGCSLICRARQDMTQKFLKDNPNCTHFFQLDDDVELPPDAILKLVQSGHDVVGGMYPHKSTAGTIALRGIKPYKISDYGDECVEVAYLSTGCFMQTREVVQKAWDHYTDLKYSANLDPKVSTDTERRALYMPYIHDDEYLSEDWAYCQRLIDMGEKIYVHNGVRCPHWGLAPYGIAE